MSQRNKIAGNINIEQIVIEVPRCPGCGREHEIRQSKPITTRNCSRQKGTFKVTVIPQQGQLVITVTFTDLSMHEKEVTDNVNIVIS